MKLNPKFLTIAVLVLLFGSIGLYQNCSEPIKSLGGDVLEDPLNNADCSIDNYIIRHGTSFPAYLAPSVPAGQTCQSELRTCNNGTLSGTYAYTSCTVQGTNTSPFAALDVFVEVNGQRLASTASVPYGSNYKLVIANVNNNAELIANLVGCAYLVNGTNSPAMCIGNYKCLTASCNATDNAGLVVEGNRLVQNRTNLDWNLPEFGLTHSIVIKPYLSAPDQGDTVKQVTYKNANPVGSTTAHTMWYSSDAQGLNRIVSVSRTTGSHYNNWYRVFANASTPLQVCDDIYGLKQQDYPGLPQHCYDSVKYFRNTNGTYSLGAGRQPCKNTNGTANTAAYYPVNASQLGSPVSTNYYINGGNPESDYVCPNMQQYHFHYIKSGAVYSLYPLTWTP